MTQEEEERWSSQRGTRHTTWAGVPSITRQMRGVPYRDVYIHEMSLDVASNHNILAWIFVIALYTRFVVILPVYSHMMMDWSQTYHTYVDPTAHDMDDGISLTPSHSACCSMLCCAAHQESGLYQLIRFCNAFADSHSHSLISIPLSLLVPASALVCPHSTLSLCDGWSYRTNTSHLHLLSYSFSLVFIIHITYHMLYYMSTIT